MTTYTGTMRLYRGLNDRRGYLAATWFECEREYQTVDGALMASMQAVTEQAHRFEADGVVEVEIEVSHLERVAELMGSALTRHIDSRALHPVALFTEAPRSVAWVAS